MLRVEGVHQRYRNGPPVLDGVDLACDPGLPVVLGGENGSGKSTLLRIAAGAARPAAGQVRRPGVVGYLPDRFPARLRMPPDVYLRHLAAIRGVSPAPELLDRLGFSGPRREPMSRLSKGNAQKVGLAQALGGDPGLVVLDEPWAGLDAEAAETLLGLLAEVAERASLLVTDHTGRAARIAGARHLRLAGGLLRESPPGAGDTVGPGTDADLAEPGAVTAPLPATAIVLRCPDPEAVARRLGVSGRCAGDRLHLHVPATRADALLLAALQLGCAVESVGPV
ncbi:ATP-binding cassette domain-containing protein [Pseudonocardia xishanensis]|uniref:ABC transporter ATP-binding protein n=1 Tax=Pseudonocardia xishanensis TaxID=630995 RepID=A0ABP8RDS4_9PSEU